MIGMGWSGLGHHVSWPLYQDGHKLTKADIKATFSPEAYRQYANGRRLYQSGLALTITGGGFVGVSGAALLAGVPCLCSGVAKIKRSAASGSASPVIAFGALDNGFGATQTPTYQRFMRIPCCILQQGIRISD